MSSLVLMENAGRGCADLLEKLGIDGAVTICCGKGNNGGDGFVLARHLELRGHRVRVLLWAQPRELRGDALSNFEILRRASTPLQIVEFGNDNSWLVSLLSESAWVVDALLGTGTAGSPRPPYDEAIRFLNGCKARRFSVDLPSGLDAETGRPGMPTVQADFTATFVAPKSGFRSPTAQPFLGEVHVIDIGAPAMLVRQALSPRPPDWQ